MMVNDDDADIEEEIQLFILILLPIQKKITIIRLIALQIVFNFFCS